MSPIGRVFIVINLILAGTFVGFAGTNLQRQHHYKDLYEKEKDGRQKDNANAAAKELAYQDQVNKSEVAKSALDTNLANARNENARLADDNKRLQGQLSSIEGEVKLLSSNSTAMRSEVAAMQKLANDTLQMAMNDQKAKDAAVRERDDAVAKLRDANAKIAEQEESIRDRDLKLTSLNQDKRELGLLVDVAKTKGFLESMAVPPLGGTVTVVNGRLVTISVTDNPTNAEIKPGYSFAIYEAGTYKGEARVTEAAEGVAFCTVDRPVRGTTIKQGDRAATQTR